MNNSYPKKFKASCARFSDRVALQIGDQCVTYQALDQLTDALAVTLGPTVKNRPVAICFPKSVECYVSQIAVMKAGGFYVPIDPTYPIDRIQNMISDAGVDIVLVSRETENLDYPNDVKRLIVEHRTLAEAGNADSSNLPEVKASDYAYMIYTSGSSGRPKGVPIHHAAILNHNAWCIEEFGITSADRIPQFASVSFDFSIEEILPTLLAGATLLPPSAEALRTVEDFLAWAEQERISLLNLPTAYWHEVVWALNRAEMPSSVRLCAIGGEKACPDRVNEWFKRVPNSIPLLNAYGPTETTITSSVVRLEPGKQVTIGKPISGLNYSVWNENLEEVAPGEVGELVISGAGVAAGGYWKRPKLSRERFLEKDGVRFYRSGDRVKINRNSDEFEFLGRIDDQVKIRGYRIEPGEIGEVLNLHRSITAAIVRACEVGDSTELVAYYQSNDESNCSEAGLRTHLKERLPQFMVPKFFIPIESVPKTPGGKVDHHALPEPIVSVDVEAGRKVESEVEIVLSELWKSIFGLKQVSAEGDFFGYGGDSLKAMRLVSLIESRFQGVRVPTAALVENSTLEKLAVYITEEGKKNTSRTYPAGRPVISKFNQDSSLTPIFAFHGAGGSGLFFKNIEESLSKRHPFYILESSLLFSSVAELSLPQESIPEIVSIYIESLTEEFEFNRVILTGYSLGGLFAYEAARQLAAKGVVIEKLINIDAPNPATITVTGFSRRILKTIDLLTRDPECFWEKLRFSLSEKWLRVAGFLSLESAVDILKGRAIENVYNGIEDKFVPDLYDGDMTLITSRIGEFSTEFPSDYGWKSQLRGELKKVEIPGHHRSIVEFEKNDVLLKEFRRLIEEPPVKSDAVANCL